MKVLRVLVLLAISAVSTIAQITSTSTSMQQADALYQAGQWVEAAKAYSVVTKAEPQDGRSWYRLGASLISSEQFADAVAPLQEAIRISKRAEPMYALASAYARLKDKDQAFYWLNKSLDAKLPRPRQIRSDPNLAILTTDPRFQNILVLVDKLSKRCESQPEYKQLNFWVGEWKVMSQGQQIAVNSIQPIVDNCIIYENYRQPDGYVGKSFNFFDPTLRKWRQTYVDGEGRTNDLIGEYRDGAMRFEGESHLPDGTKILRRMTLFDLAPDKVRQYSEASIDGGNTWSVYYDFLYTRMK